MSPSYRPVSHNEPPSAAASDLSIAEQFGGIDVYLFDQLQKNRFTPSMRILDAGCGSGRNLVFFLRSGYEVFGVDHDPSAIARVITMAGDLSPHLPAKNFQVADIQTLPFSDEAFDVIVCNAVLHFAEDERTFDLMCHELMRVLRPNAFLFTRLASDIGIEDRVVSRGDCRGVVVYPKYLVTGEVCTPA